jgi:hypothetical protein
MVDSSGLVPEELIYDSWTPISFKRALGARSSSSGAGVGWSAPSWVGDHRRRLLAYTILRAYQDNAAREFMLTNDREEVDNRREYGDPALVVNAILGALLGDSQVISVEGSEDFDPDKPNKNPDAQRAVELEEWLQDWAKDERFGLKMIETERKAVGLGDGLYSVGWSMAKGRPRLRCWDPGFYFPVLDEGNEDDFPEKVHIAWELPPEDGTLKRRIRRITWELGNIAPENTPGLIAGLFTEPTVFPGDKMGSDGRISREYAWNEGEPSFRTCYMSDGTWTLDTGKSKVDDLTEESAIWEMDEDGIVCRRDLMIDFLPVIHIPNTVALLEHYGRSSLSTVLQVFDDLAAADTDLASAAATTGSPVLALQKSTMGTETHKYKPGQILEVGEGKMDVLDTSRALVALLEYITFLLKRLSVNARLPEAVLGRVSPSEVPSGIALALSFGPLEQMVKEMRLTRDEKYPLLLKFVQRLASAGGTDEVPDVWDLEANVQFGSYLPQDQAEAVKLVTQLLANKPLPIISLETAIQMLIDAGFEIRDAALEVQRISERDFAGASALLDATGDEDLVYEYLGRGKPPKPKEQPPVPPLIPPGTVLGPDGLPLSNQPPPVPPAA